MARGITVNSHGAAGSRQLMIYYIGMLPPLSCAITIIPPFPTKRITIMIPDVPFLDSSKHRRLERALLGSSIKNSLLTQLCNFLLLVPAQDCPPNYENEPVKALLPCLMHKIKFCIQISSLLQPPRIRT